MKKYIIDDVTDQKWLDALNRFPFIKKPLQKGDLINDNIAKQIIDFNDRYAKHAAIVLAEATIKK